MKLPNQERKRLLALKFYNDAAQFVRTETERKRDAAEEEPSQDLEEAW